MAPNIFNTVNAGVKYDEHSMKRQLTEKLNCGSSVCNFLHVTLLAPRISGLLDLWKLCGPLIYIQYSVTSIQACDATYS